MRGAGKRESLGILFNLICISLSGGEIHTGRLFYRRSRHQLSRLCPGASLLMEAKYFTLLGRFSAAARSVLRRFPSLASGSCGRGAHSVCTPSCSASSCLSSRSRASALCVRAGLPLWGRASLAGGRRAIARAVGRANCVLREHLFGALDVALSIGNLKRCSRFIC